MMDERERRPVAEAIFVALEWIAAFALFLSATAIYLEGHRVDLDRAFNFVACGFGSGVLVAIGLITGHGRCLSAAEQNASRFDWLKQEMIRHGDFYIAGALIAVSIFNVAVETVPPAMAEAQVMISFIAGFWIVGVVMVTKKIQNKSGEQAFKNSPLHFKPSQRAIRIMRAGL